MEASPTSESVDGCLQMLGKDHVVYGAISQATLGEASACLSVGGDAKSPSMAFKADKSQPNEDGLLVKRSDNLYLLAVSDAHYGVEASHGLLSRLAQAELPRTRWDLLRLCRLIQVAAEDGSSGATLLVALFDSDSGQVIALSTGDSTLATLDGAGWRVHNVKDQRYVHLDRISHPDSWNETELWLEPGSVLVLHTDGVDECHYRKPATSLQPAHIQAVWERAQGKTLHDRASHFAAALTQAALDGVDGNPGGQDNIAVLVVPFSLSS